MGRRAKSPKGKVEAKRAPARKSPKDEGSGVRDLEGRLAEALGQLQTRDRELVEAQEQQTATSEILQVISSSPTDVQPVFDAIARNAARLCDAYDAAIFRRDGNQLILVAQEGPIPYGPYGPIGTFTVPVVRGTINGRSVLEGRTVHVADLQVKVDDFPEGSEYARRLGHRANLSVPLMRKGVAIGTINLRRPEAELFTDKQVALLQTFADQAVIAIENVRLFTELQQKNEALTTAHAQVSESLEQQTATAEILRVISGSPTDAQPVFETIAASALRLCNAQLSVVLMYDGQLIDVAAEANVDAEQLEAIRSAFPRPVSRGGATERAILTRTAVNIADVHDDPEYGFQRLAQAARYRSIASVPMLREGQPIGAITITQAVPGGFAPQQVTLLQTFADQAVIAIENVRLFTELQEKNRALTEAHALVTEALDRQTATSAILQVISNSPTDVQPVFDAIAESSWRLCGATNSTVYRFDGELLHLAAHHGLSPEALEVARTLFPSPPHRGIAGNRAMLDRTVVHLPDVLEDPEYLQAYPRAVGVRSVLAAPMLREGQAVGVVVVSRAERGWFSERQVELLKTFADQAVIAIENVRLFNETKEALERQTATSEILQVISKSPTDVQPVYDAIVRSAVTLCGATLATVYRREADLVHVVGIQHEHPHAAEVTAAYPAPVTSSLMSCRAILENAVIHLPDVEAEGALPPEGLRLARLSGFRSVVSVPLRREGRAIGAILVGRRALGVFPDEHIALLQMFADQAVIAIENVRLFTELQEKNRALTAAHAQVTEALDQQTATSEILQVISSSPTGVQPVFEAIAAAATRLCETDLSGVYPFDGTLIHFAAEHGRLPEEVDAARRAFPQPPSRLSVTARAVLAAAVVQVDDVSQDPDVAETLRMFRTVLSVPMLKDGRSVGAITVGRRVVRPFTDTHIELLKTFADQAVIAIENVRLFKETKEALEQQTATSEILRVISSSPTDVQPVFETIAEHAMRLCSALHGVVLRFDGELIHLAALANASPEAADTLRGLFPTPPGRHMAASRAILTGAMVHIPDVQNDPDYVIAGQARTAGYRSIVAVPMLRDRSRGSGGGLRGIPAGGDGGEEGRGHRPRAGALTEVHRAARRADLGEESGGRRLAVHVYPAGAP
jgi:GAF domain-containing protein